MSRLATYSWRTPPPASIDEELVIFDGDEAFLVVRAPRDTSPTIGTYRTRLPDHEQRALEHLNTRDAVFDPIQPLPDDAGPMAFADRVATLVRRSAEAVATFHAAAVPGAAPGELSLLVIAAGTRPVEFELEPQHCTLHFLNDDTEVVSTSLPDLRAGFVTTESRSLGGIGRAAVIDPGTYGAIMFNVEVPVSATSVAIDVAGQLHLAIPDHPQPQPFRARTAPAALPTE